MAINMDEQFAFITISLVLSFFLSLGIALFSWQRRHAGIWAKPFAFLAGAVAWWSIFYALELSASSVELKLIWAKIEYIAIVSIPVLWFLFAMAYTARLHWLRPARVVLLWVIPVITLMLVAANEWHALIWRQVALEPVGMFSILDLSYGVGFWVHSVYSYGLLLVGTAVLLIGAYRAPRPYRWQNVGLALGALIPWIANAIYLLELTPGPNVDWSPSAFAVSGLILTWSIFRFQLFDIAPVACRLAVDMMPEGLLVLDVQDRIVDMNSAAQAIFERSLADVIGVHVADLLTEWPNLYETHKDVMETRTELSLTIDGEVRYFDLQITPIYDTRRKLNGRLILYYDISSYKASEATLAEVRDQALTVSRVKSELLARVSHELRTPLNVILGYTEMIQEGIWGEVNEKQYEAMDKVLQSTRFLTRQVNDLLDISSIESGSLLLHCTEFPVVDLVDHVVADSRTEVLRKSLTLESRIHEDMPERVYGDQERVTQILANLVENAIKFSECGTIQIDIHRVNGRYWAMSVSDEGPGIPPEAKTLIFEPFRQIDGSMTRIHGGTGLGLAIVQRLTDLMGGRIELESQVGQGSTFTVILPNTPETERVWPAEA
jgi:PAS domain S-box-containing protein